MATSAAAQTSPNQTSTASLVEQARALAKEQPDVALGMYRAAIHLSPNDPEPHLLAAQLLLERRGCEEAVPEFRLWLSLVEQPPPDIEQYTQVVMQLGECLKPESAANPAPATMAKTRAVAKADIEPPPETEDIPLLDLPEELPAPPPPPEPDEMPLEETTRDATNEAEATEPNVGATPTQLELVIGQPHWTCRLGDYVCEPNAEGEILIDLAPGDYTLDCTHPTARPLSQPVTILEGQRVRVSIGVSGKKKETSSADDLQEPEQRASSVEPMFGAGVGPSLAEVGVAGGVRFGSFSVLAATGLDPLALSATWHVSPGKTGLYVTGGWMLRGNGILRDGVVPTGQAIFGGGGVEVRFQNAFLLRLGAGLRFDTFEGGNGPLTFDLSAFWLP